MMQTVEAVIYEDGKIRFLESVKIKSVQRVWVTIPLASDSVRAESLAGLGKILDDDLESANRDISAKFRDSINRSAEEL